MTMAHKKKKMMETENEEPIYTNNIHHVRIYRDKNKSLFFECENPALIENFKTYDIAEAVAALIKIQKILNDKNIWNIKIDSEDYNISAEKALYWLSGGNAEWITYENYNCKWMDVYKIYTDEFSSLVYDIIDKSSTLGDIKNEFMKHLNLPVLYEFALEKNLVKIDL